MRRTMLSLLFVLCLAGAAFSAVSLENWLPYEPSVTDSGGPDLYGYKWKQTADLGGPPYAWREISSVGTLVTGLGDDNYVGPFPIGFPFHYYWYDVTQYWIGSNGYLEFGPAFNAASPFPNSIPLTANPNNFLAVYMSDLDMSVTGPTCHRWNNADSCIIQWTNVPWWGTTPIGSHTFQIILSRLDSNITFEYGTQTGVQTTPDILVGIENVSGTMGLRHSNDVYPISNNAIKWYHPANPTVVVHDMESKAAANATSEGIFVLQGGTVNPTGWIKNAGNASETGFTINLTIQLVGGGVVYNQTQTYTNTIAPNVTEQINFTPAWTASATGTYFYRLTVNLTGDMNPINNIKTTECTVMTLPGTMLYDDGTSEQAWSWSGGFGGLGNYFVPPSYPARIDCVKYFIAGGGNNFIARILDDDGPGGNPGTQLYQTVIQSPLGTVWVGADISSQNIQITSGGVFVAWVKEDALTTPTFGVDNTTTQPQSRRGWEFTGGNTWSNFRQNEGSDIMIRARISTPGAQPNLDVTLTPINPPIVIPAQGGSFQFTAAVVNNGPAGPFWGWCRIKYPDGTYTGPTVGPIQINPPVGLTVSRQRTQNVPNTWPSGIYTYLGYANTQSQVYPAIDSSSFTFQKLADATNGPVIWDATCYGEAFPGEIVPQPPVYPINFSMKGATPNPFNPSTTISFTLPETVPVTLNVYDMSGRLVSTLVNGLREAGNHQITFDGSNLSSGMYLYRLTAGANSAVGKMMLVK